MSPDAAEHPEDLPPRDPAPETEAGDRGSAPASGGGSGPDGSPARPGPDGGSAPDGAPAPTGPDGGSEERATEDRAPGSASGAAEADGLDPASPDAIERDPSTAGGPSGDVPDAVDRLRGG